MIPARRSLERTRHGASRSPSPSQGAARIVEAEAGAAGHRARRVIIRIAKPKTGMAELSIALARVLL